LVLENNLIKEHHPKYNTMLKDDKSYPFMKVTVQEDFPRVLFARQMKRDGAKYFGPYTSAAAVKDTIELMKKLYGIRTCNKSLPKEIGNGRPCLYYQMKQCAAPCQGYISKEEYGKRVDKLLGFLNGDYKKVLSELEQKMKEKSAQLEFEEAAEYRDLIESVQHVTGSQRVVKTGGIDRDVIAMARKEEETVVSVFFVRDGKLLGREHFHLEHSKEDNGSQIITAFIKQYYSGTPFVPNELLTEFPVEELQLLEEWLGQRRGGRVHIIAPQKGEKHKMIDLARENAKVVLSRDLEKMKREEARTAGAARELAKMLGLPLADRLEAYDISNTSGYQSVASMVVFEKGRAKKNAYRKFKLRTVTGPDDYRSMEEVLTRRFTDERFDVYPDLIMMDGGRGQVNVALRVLEQLHLNIPVAGMVKDDNHRTRGLYFNNEEIQFPKNSEVFGMITRLQDEAHRFAITYHKQLRGKEQVHSILDDIDGVGPARRKALMQHFKDIEKIKTASVEDLMAVKGITGQVAESVYHFFHEEES
jgi:excinuclease ABC subunit C